MERVRCTGRASARAPGVAAVLSFVELSKCTDNKRGGVGLSDDFAGGLVHYFDGQVIQVRGGRFVWDRQEAARITPKSAAASEPFRDCLLTLFVQVLAEVAGRTHVPRHEVGAFLPGICLPSILTFEEVKSEVFRTVWLSDPVPGLGQLPLKSVHMMWETQPHVEVRYAASLELQHPQIMHTREAPTKTSQPCVKMPLDGAPVRGRVVIGQAELRYERNTGVVRQIAQPAARVSRESLYLCPFWGNGVRTLSRSCTYHFQRTRIGKEGIGGVVLRYAAINKRCIRRSRSRHPPVRAGREAGYTATPLSP